MIDNTLGDRFCAIVYGPVSQMFMYLFAVSTVVLFLIKSPLAIVALILTGLNLYQYKVVGSEYRKQEEDLLKMPEKAKRTP
jgi:hypothetical protein